MHKFLGYAGLIPFIGLAVLIQFGYTDAQTTLISYAALIFSFLGGVQWMVSLQNALSTTHQVISVSMMLWAWLWLLLPELNWFLISGLSFWLLWVYERIQFSQHYSEDFMILRRNLSAIAGLSLMVTGVL